MVGQENVAHTHFFDYVEIECKERYFAEKEGDYVAKDQTWRLKSPRFKNLSTSDVKYVIVQRKTHMKLF